jgi:hypothetical protein
MESIKKTVRGEHSINTGVLTEYKIDLAVNEGYSGGRIVADALGYTTASVTVVSTKATGTSGTALIKQSNSIGGTSFPLATPATVDFVPNETKGAFDLKVSGHFLVVDITPITFGVVGNVTIEIVLKR